MLASLTPSFRPNNYSIMSSRIRLHVSKGTDAGKTFDVLPGQTLVVGRGTGSHTRLRDPEMSRLHFSLEYSDGRIKVVDLGSSSGTFLNGSSITELNDADSGDEIVAGGTKMFISFVGNLESETISPSKNSIVDELHVLLGTLMDSYFLRRIIGVGKTGLVFEAYDEAKDRPAAVKVFSKRLTSNSKYRDQFIRGFKAFCKIQDPHLVRLYQAGKNSSAYFYAAMELIDGESIDSLIERVGIGGMLDWKEVWSCAYQISGALVATYKQDVVHRNLVPRNIIRRHSNQQFLLGDFSLATPVDSRTQNFKKIEFVRNLHYLPPERLRASKNPAGKEREGNQAKEFIDIRSDIFGLGATCYAMLTGKPPADGIDVPDIIDNIRFELPSAPRNVHLAVNEQFQSIVMKMIAKNPNDRFQDPQSLVRELVRVARINGLKF